MTVAPITTAQVETIINSDTLDNLATSLQMIVMRRLAKVVDLITQGVHQDTLEEFDVSEYALEEFDGLKAEFRLQLVDREWTGARVGPAEAVR